jgi:hypothetical protein
MTSPTSSTTWATARGYLNDYADRPAAWNETFLGRALWPKQAEVCDAVARTPITLVPAGRAVGKSYVLAGLALWWLYTRREALVITTGPDHRQVVSVLWKEVRRAIRGANVRLRHGHLTQGYVSPQRLDLPNGNSAIGFACKTNEGISGQHARNLLFIVDEATGVLPEIWEAIWGAAAARYVIAGNPIRYDCLFRELHDRAPTPDLASVPISCLDHPHAGLEHSPDGAVCGSWLRQQREMHGEGSPWWNSNVLGLFPGAESVRFLPAAWVDACNQPGLESDPLWQDLDPGLPIMGVDVGGGVGADRSAICVRDRRRVLELWASADHGVFDDARMRLEPEVARLAREHRVPAERIVYDQGGPGRNFGSYLARHGLDGAIGHFGAGRGGVFYANRRTANAFMVKRRLDPNRKGFAPFSCVGLPDWPMLRHELGELRSPTMELDEGIVKQRLEDKEAMKSRLGRSPDLLDAFLMTFSFED